MQINNNIITERLGGVTIYSAIKRSTVIAKLFLIEPHIIGYNKTLMFHYQSQTEGFSAEKIKQIRRNYLTETHLFESISIILPYYSVTEDITIDTWSLYDVCMNFIAREIRQNRDIERTNPELLEWFSKKQECREEEVNKMLIKRVETLLKQLKGEYDEQVFINNN